MIKTVPFDVIMNFILGLFIALACEAQVRTVRSAMFNKYFLGVVLFGLFFFVPIGVYLYYFHTDWSWMYYSPLMHVQRRTIVGLGFLAMSGYLLALIAGYQIGQYWIRAEQAGLAKLVLGGLLAVLLIYTLVSLKRLGSVGTFAEWQAGKGVPLFRTAMNYIIGLSAVVGGVALTSMIRAFRGEPAA